MSQNEWKWEIAWGDFTSRTYYRTANIYLSYFSFLDFDVKDKELDF